ncbi:MAG TPA: hypothetical protein PKC21_08205 [Oligoflexia bacterium]|nr:hypothetical protein [Oligoflexia bacterium]HMR25321.1 hypothetical protein [Oligoflexia bacterium]
MMLETLRSVAQSIFSRNPLGQDHHYFYDDMIEYFDAKIKANRNDIKAYLILGKLFRLKGQAERAFKLHANLLSHPQLNKRDLPQLYLEIGFDALHAKLDDYGVEHFEKALLNRQTAPLAHYGLFKAYALQDNKEKTRKHLETLVNQNHAPKNILVNLYQKHLDDLKDKSAANSYLNLSEKALALDPQNNAIQLHYAQALHKNKYDNEALDYINTVIAESSYISDFLKLTEDIFYAQNKYSELEYQLANWLKKSDHPEIHILMAKLLQKKHKLEQAKHHLQAAFKLNPKNPNIFLTALSCNFNAQDFKDLS